MSRKDRIKGLYQLPTEDEKLAMANSPKPLENKEKERVPAGPVRSMGLALGRIEEETKALQSALATGSQVVDLEPSMIDVSMVRDRLAGDDASYEELRRSIQERGQEVPILVRPHPTAQGRFQVAYGHRRLRAVAELGGKIKAVVRTMTDAELVIAQGVENSARQDLSYIEKALFAARLEDRGFERTIIIDALSTDKGELSKLISVARAVPEEVIEAIGPAPKAGRRRWQALAEAIEKPATKKAVEKAAKDPSLAGLATDARFVKVLAAGTKATQEKGAKLDVVAVNTASGRKVAQVTKSGRDLKIAIDKKFDAAFADFLIGRLAEQLPVLAEEYTKAGEEMT
jgi:ParB family transcriptional regulator, chromosome partitioning protein